MNWKTSNSLDLIYHHLFIYNLLLKADHMFFMYYLKSVLQTASGLEKKIVVSRLGDKRVDSLWFDSLNICDSCVNASDDKPSE